MPMFLDPIVSNYLDKIIHVHFHTVLFLLYNS